MSKKRNLKVFSLSMIGSLFTFSKSDGKNVQNKKDNIVCGYCKRIISINDDTQEKTHKCPNCNREIMVPFLTKDDLEGQNIHETTQSEEVALNKNYSKINEIAINTTDFKSKNIGAINTYVNNKTSLDSHNNSVLNRFNNDVQNITSVKKSISKNMGVVPKIIVTEQYKRVLNLIKDGCPVVFVSGNAGTGKSMLIYYIRENLRMNIAVTAPTGIAALNIDGVTIHSFFCFPPKIIEDSDIKDAYDKRLFLNLQLLVIDEVSMVRADIIDAIDMFLRKNCEKDIPFGGVQLLLVGDLFQLPPVTQQDEMILLQERSYAGVYFFSAFSLQQLSMASVELTHIFRQKDPEFIKLLNKVRVAEDVENVVDKLNELCFNEDKKRYDITLTSTNIIADGINNEKLKRLRTKQYSFYGEITGRFSYENDRLPSPEKLNLKARARVMFTKNGEYWKNGTLGIIDDISDEAITVRLVTDTPGAVHTVSRAKWTNYRYKYDAEKKQIVSEEVGTYTQYPLKLAWAVTIHKCQGRTLDKVMIDLGYGAFANGQTYVALSRCRSLKGIRLRRCLRNSDVMRDPKIKAFYEMIFDTQDLSSDSELFDTGETTDAHLY